VLVYLQHLRAGTRATDVITLKLWLQHLWNPAMPLASEVHWCFLVRPTLPACYPSSDVVGLAEPRAKDQAHSFSCLRQDYDRQGLRCGLDLIHHHFLHKLHCSPHTNTRLPSHLFKIFHPTTFATESNRYTNEVHTIQQHSTIQS
jgi:hypothetical protein